MSALIISLTLLALFVALIVALPFVHAAWRRAVARDANLQIWQVMARRGIVTDQTPATQATLARAVRRCVLCPSIEQCDRWLASNAREGLEDFCPNATLIEQLEIRNSPTRI